MIDDRRVSALRLDVLAGAKVADGAGYGAVLGKLLRG
jgi:hypothetical protein